MTIPKFLPSLSEDGWVDTTIKKADYLLSHFFLSDYSQSYIYFTKVSSLPWIIHKTQGNMSETVSMTQSVLSNYFSRYFNSVVVEVAEVINEAEPSVGQIRIYIQFTDETGKDFVLGKLLEIADLTIRKIIDLNNG